MTETQLALVRLMQRAINSSDYVHEWRHLFQGAMIRATTVRGKQVTLQRGEVDGLVESGVIDSSWGGSFYLTDLGRGL